MVDLDQCTHATINGCDKERRGWYPLPSSLSSSICLPSCPPPCPLPNCFSLMIAHLHLRWHPPGHRLSWCRGPADGKGAWCAVGCLHPPRSTCSMGELWALSVRLIMRSCFHLLSHTCNFFLFCSHANRCWAHMNLVLLTISPLFWTRHYVLPSADANSHLSFHFLQEICVWTTSAPNWISSLRLSWIRWATEETELNQNGSKAETQGRKWSRGLTEWIHDGWKWARVHAGKQI